MARIGILALQGAFARHAGVLAALAHEAVLVRAKEDLAGLRGLILPGGESTVQLKLLERLGLEESLCAAVRSGLPVLATCAGLVLLARHVSHPQQRSLGMVDVGVARNAWGRQIDSFEATSDAGRALVFIRAPRIVEVGRGVEVLDRLRGESVLVRQANVTCATFHPELTSDTGLHREVFR
jgi:5'-phosphate synthase pdxT subunit